MLDETSRAPRRRLLKRGLALAAGGIGLGFVARASPTQAATAPPQRVEPRPQTLTLYGRALHLYGADHRHGATPSAGDRLTSYAELCRSLDGEAVGELHGASFNTGSPNVSGRYATGSVEFHTFALTDGTLIGMGIGGGETSVFAVVGGTGRYRGASGSYVARLRPFDQGGDGSAEFTFTLNG